jgi:hypothetical protein
MLIGQAEVAELVRDRGGRLQNVSKTVADSR